MRLTALAMPTTQSTVMSGDRSADRTTKPAKGIRKKSSVTPSRESRLPEKTWPATLAGGDTGRRSSRRPTANMTLAATSRPRGSELPRNMGLKAGMSQATPRAATNPPNMAAPPRVGVGLQVDPPGVGLRPRHPA